MLLTPLFAKTGLFDEPSNRVQHIGLHYGISTVSTLVAIDYGLTKQQAWLVGFGVSAVIGIGKEVYDTNFDWNDVAANTFGGVIGSTSIIYIKF